MTTAVATKIEVGKAEGFKIQFNQTACEFNALDKDDKVVASAGSKAYLIRKLKKKELNVQTHEKLKGVQAWTPSYNHGSYKCVTFTGDARIKKERWGSKNKHELKVTDDKGGTSWIDRFYHLYDPNEKLHNEISVATTEAQKAQQRLTTLKGKQKSIKISLKKLVPTLKLSDY